MTSKRHSSSSLPTAERIAHDRPRTSRVASNRVADDALLDATRECVLAHGVRRTTLTEVARHAGVSRMTLYRRVPDVTSLVAALMSREFAALLDSAVDAAQHLNTARERLVTSAVHAVRLLHDAPVLRRVIEHDPELLLPYVFRRLGTTQRVAEHFLHEQLLLGHADGSIRHADPGPQARSLLLLTQSFVLSPGTAEAEFTTQALLDELEHALDAALRPR